MKLSGMKTIRDEIVKQLQEVYDPEISINVFDLGLIYDIQINEEERSVEITHTLTSAFCGFADVIAEDIRKAGYVDGIDNVSIVTTFDPPFTLDMVPEETKLAMGW
jgi:metal-sulfur cluster biosynthetic enzyme